MVLTLSCQELGGLQLETIKSQEVPDLLRSRSLTVVGAVTETQAL